MVAGNNKEGKIPNPTKNPTSKQGRTVQVGTTCMSIGISFMPHVKRFHLYSEKTSERMFWVAEDIQRFKPTSALKLGRQQH